MPGREEEVGARPREKGLATRETNQAKGNSMSVSRQDPEMAVQFHGMWTAYTDDQRMAILNQLQAANIRSVRLDVSWAMLQPTNATSYDAWGVAFVDRVIAHDQRPRHDSAGDPVAYADLGQRRQGRAHVAHQSGRLCPGRPVGGRPVRGQGRGVGGVERAEQQRLHDRGRPGRLREAAAGGLSGVQGGRPGRDRGVRGRLLQRRRLDQGRLRRRGAGLLRRHGDPSVHGGR